ncbi:hypothetical protein IQ238_25405 [Pleurocapsales cyanobacterium LEGE 06147]|nr:hypothetical protein [Pleurocapsales cyanobacterium LEGE 06147]
MFIFLVLLVGLVANWILSGILITIPEKIINYFGSFFWLGLLLLLVLFLSWCMGDS